MPKRTNCSHATTASRLWCRKRSDWRAAISVMASIPEGCQKLAGGRSETETTVLSEKKTRHPGRGARNEAVGRFCDPTRVELVRERNPGVAAFGLPPG